MLAGEDFGWRHQHRLPACLGSGSHGHQCDHGLARADVALEQTQQLPGTKASVIVGVSCNPQTFARDARVLVDAGFRLERVTPIDQFIWSTHIELVGVFRR